jgi:hypothetical protein
VAILIAQKGKPMKKILFSLGVIAALTLSACGTSAPPATPTIDPALVQSIAATMVAGNVLGSPAAVVPPADTPAAQSTPLATLPPGGPTAEPATANPEHLAKLQEGKDAWNAWRTQNPDIRPDLTRADLRGMNLAGYDLSSAFLTKAILKKANLTAANLRGAIMKGANLTEAKLKNARLIKARLSGADLTGADLTGAKLTDAEYDASTKWPAGFDPVAAGAVLAQ